jgi:hypothetical protein
LILDFITYLCATIKLKDMIKGVITGDIVDSTLISNEWKPTIKESLERVVSDFIPMTKVSYEMYRGDSFQVIVDDITFALSVGIAIRAVLGANTPNGMEPWDARIAIGIGDISFVSESIITNDGEAFRFSGREFDMLGKRRLAVVTPNDNINQELKLTTSFADELITKWSIKQADIIYFRIISNASQKELAATLGMSTQNFSKLWNSGNGHLIQSYIERYKELMTKL